MSGGADDGVRPVICAPTGACGGPESAPTVDRPQPGMARLRRRLGHHDELLADLIRRAEQRSLDGQPAGRRWDIEGDPAALELVGLWAHVAEGVSAYAELTAGEGYLATAQDWLDLARLADQVGYRPAQRVAAEGWVRFETDRLAGPLIPAGTQVQAPGTPDRAPQTFEVVEDTRLAADWADLTATWVPSAAVPDGRSVRFLGDPGFRAGDDVLLIKEEKAGPASSDWLAYWLWLLGLGQAPTSGSVTPIAVVTVVDHRRELGTTVVAFDRAVDGLIDLADTPYAAYRIVERAASARRLSSVLWIPEPDDDPATDDSATRVQLPAYAEDAGTATSLVLDRKIDELSTDSLVAVVNWDIGSNQGDVLSVQHHVPIEWEVAPGTPVLVSKLHFAPDPDGPIGTLDNAAGPLDLYVLDRRVPVTHHVFPTDTPSQAPGAGLRIRVWPAPTTATPPSGRLAVQTTVDQKPTWELLEVDEGYLEIDPDSGETNGLILDVVGRPPLGRVELSPASGNVARVRHGVSEAAVLGSGDGVTPHRTVQPPDAPIAAELADDGSAVNSLRLSIDSRLWPERETLFDAGPTDGYETRIGPDGEMEIRFGDAIDGAIVPSGTANITATYRIGGGTVGEVDSEAIDTLLGSIRGVRSVLGAGPTANGADQPTERELRRRAPTRARAMDRIVALADAADLALAFPGVSHAVAWNGQAPPGVDCGPGPMVAVLRIGSDGVRAALPAELDALTAYLDARRDVALPLCVTTAEVVPVAVTLVVAAEPVVEASALEAALIEVLTDPDGLLAAPVRTLGQPLDRSDVVAVVHRVDGVVGIESLSLRTPMLDSGASAIGRLPAERYQLLVAQPPTIQVVFR